MPPCGMREMCNINPRYNPQKPEPRPRKNCPKPAAKTPRSTGFRASLEWRF
jgi:hypothetical protein